jgi:hypothetical protein
MRRYRKTPNDDTPTLVPLADMLTNTVGIMLFILAFTVLASGGAVIAKRLPMERKTKAKPIHFVCSGQRLLPLDFEFAGDFTKPLGKPTYDTAERWVREFNNRKLSNDFFEVTGEGEVLGGGFFNTQKRLDLTLQFQPKPGKGETKEELTNATSLFLSILSTNNNAERFVYFMVYPDSIEVFQAARNCASQRYSMRAGWTPVRQGKSIGLSLTSSGGIRPDSQTD